MAAGPPANIPPRSLLDRGRDLFAERRAAAVKPGNTRIAAKTTGKKTEAQEAAEQKRMADRVAHGIGSFAETAAGWYMGEDEPSPVINPRQLTDLQATIRELLEDSTFFKLVSPYLLWVILLIVAVPIIADLMRRKRAKAKAAATKDHWSAGDKATPAPAPAPPPGGNVAPAWWGEVFPDG